MNCGSHEISNQFHSLPWNCCMVDYCKKVMCRTNLDSEKKTYHCPCGNQSLVLTVDYWPDIPYGFCIECWINYYKQRLRNILWKRRKKVPKDTWDEIPYPVGIWDLATSWD